MKPSAVKKVLQGFWEKPFTDGSRCKTSSLDLGTTLRWNLHKNRFYQVTTPGCLSVFGNGAADLIVF